MKLSDIIINADPSTFKNKPKTNKKNGHIENRNGQMFLNDHTNYFHTFLNNPDVGVIKTDQRKICSWTSHRHYCDRYRVTLTLITDRLSPTQSLKTPLWLSRGPLVMIYYATLLLVDT